MPRRDPRTRDRPAARASRPLASLLAHSTTPNDLLPHLHQHALDVDRRRRARCCSSTTRATACCRRRPASASTRSRTDPWMPGAGRSGARRRRVRAAARRRSSPTPIAQMPDLAARLDTPRGAAAAAGRAATSGSACSRSASTSRRRPRDVAGDAVEAADAFLTALELFRLRQARRAAARPPRAARRVHRQPLGDAEPRRRPRHLLPRRQPAVRRRPHVGLDSRSPRASARAAGLVRSRPTSRAACASAPTTRRRRRRSPCGARAPRSSAPGRTTATAMVTVPLRGCRRALGTIVFEGVRVETGGELDLLDRADELGRQLSSAIENMQLLDDVMRSRRELENTFDSISHLVAVSDTRGHIVHVNQAFATRVGRDARASCSTSRSPITSGPSSAAGSSAHERSPARPARRLAVDRRSRRSGAERAVHGDGHRSARTTTASGSAA